LAFVPPLLRVLLSLLISNPLKQAAIGQCLVQAVKPEGCIMPLPFAVGVNIADSGLRIIHLH